MYEKYDGIFSSLRVKFFHAPYFPEGLDLGNFTPSGILLYQNVLILETLEETTTSSIDNKGKKYF